MANYNSGACYNRGENYNKAEKDKMDKEIIAKKVHSVVSGELKNVPFDKGLPRLRKILWEIADDYGINGADVFIIYMDWLSSQNN